MTMKRFTIFIFAIMVVSISFSQTILPKDLKLNKSIITHPINANVTDEAYDATNDRGVGINNAVLFNNWSAMVPLVIPMQVPNGWILQTGNEAAQKSTDVYAGNFAVHIESGQIVIDQAGNTDLFGGVALIGKVSIDWSGPTVNMTQGEPFTQRPISMSFAIKGNLLAEDTAVVGFTLTKNTAIVGGVIVTIGQGDISATDYTVVHLDIEYENALTPDTALILATSSGVGVFQGVDIGTLTEGSYIIVDNFILNYSPVNIEEKNLPEIKLYPNPATNHIIVENAENKTIEIYDALSRLIKTINNSTNNQIINIDNLPVGFYYIKIDNEVRKFSKN